MTTALPVSYLFVPGNRPERFDKARAAGAGAVIVDLEDAVPAQSKDLARDMVRDALDAARPVWVRVNSADTPWPAMAVSRASCCPRRRTRRRPAPCWRARMPAFS
jgi:citrate lyase beta subunit